MSHRSHGSCFRLPTARFLVAFFIEKYMHFSRYSRRHKFEDFSTTVTFDTGKLSDLGLRTVFALVVNLQSRKKTSGC
jgi:hypothetical protein